jgi:hypothetical protein
MHFNLEVIKIVDSGLMTQIVLKFIDYWTSLSQIGLDKVFFANLSSIRVC